MLLNNFASTLYPNMKATCTDGKIKDVSFSDIDIVSQSSTYYTESDRDNSTVFAPFKRGIVFGSGTTPPKKTDYKIENHIATGLTYSNNNTSTTNNIASWVQTVQNTSDEPITITEVGLFCYPNLGNFVCVLVTRTVLDTPVVLQPNDVKTFTITIDYNKFIDGTIVQNA